MNSPENQPDQQRASVQATVTQQVVGYAGPIPDPDTLKRYNQVKPDFAERIMVMAEKEQSNRHSTEKLLVNNQDVEHKRDTFTYRLGQILALTSVLLIVLLCGYLAMLGYPIQSATIACTVIVGLAGTFIFNKVRAEK